MKEWWLDFFDDMYGDVILHTFDDQEIKDSVDYLVKKFNITKETRIYDQCCGKGSMSIPLLNESKYVYGCDIIESYIKGITSQTSTGFFVADDAKLYKPTEKMDLVINWHTSFGYSRNDNDNIEMLKRAYESLKENGAFIMEYINFEFVVKNFKKTMIQNKSINNEEITVVRDSYFEEGMLKQDWTIKENPSWRKTGETKIYFEHELKDMLQNIGFKNINVFFDLKESSNGKKMSPKMYLIAYK